MQQLTIHQYYKLPTEAGALLLLYTKIKPDSSEVFLVGVGLNLWVAPDTGRLHLWSRKMGIYPLSALYSVDDLVECDEVEKPNVPPGDPCFWL
jgi:hypothetical protein